MTKNNQENINIMLSELGYLFSTPEAEYFHYNLNNKNYEKAKDMLLKKSNLEYAIAVIDYFKNKLNEKFKLIEKNYEDFHIDNLLNKDASTNKVIVNYRGNIINSYLYCDNTEFFIYSEYGKILLKDVEQIWIIEKI